MLALRPNNFYDKLVKRIIPLLLKMKKDAGEKSIITVNSTNG